MQKSSKFRHRLNQLQLLMAAINLVFATSDLIQAFKAKRQSR